MNGPVTAQKAGMIAAQQYQIFTQKNERFSINMKSFSGARRDVVTHNKKHKKR
jgi:hypothetical protein